MEYCQRVHEQSQEYQKVAYDKAAKDPKLEVGQHMMVHISPVKHKEEHGNSLDLSMDPLGSSV